MSVESARAFCVRMMSDEDFRNALGSAASGDVIAKTLKEESYDFSKYELLKVISEFVGKNLQENELEGMICDFYKEEINTDSNASCDAVVAWLKTLA